MTFSGVGLFCPQVCTLTVHPAPGGAGPQGEHGVWFEREDLPEESGGPIAARTVNVVTRPRQTVLSHAGRGDPARAVQTIEHLMSALAGLGISSARITVHGPEVPILDGSALPFVNALKRAGVVECPWGGGVGPIVVMSRVEVVEGGAKIVAEPLEHDGGGSARLLAAFELDYGPGAALPVQRAEFTLVHDGSTASEYAREIAPARTFCTVQEAQALRAAGLFGHLTAADIPVIGPNGPIEGVARFGNEPARHKVLDLIGDLALAGRPIHGKVTATRAGHALNHAMSRALLAHADLSSAHG